MIYKGHHYRVTDAAVTATGKVETWVADNREQAIEMALYTHKIHNRDAYVTKCGIIHCGSCGEIAIVKDKGQVTA